MVLSCASRSFALDLRTHNSLMKFIFLLCLCFEVWTIFLLTLCWTFNSSSIERDYKYSSFRRYIERVLVFLSWTINRVSLDMFSIYLITDCMTDGILVQSDILFRLTIEYKLSPLLYRWIFSLHCGLATFSFSFWVIIRFSRIRLQSQIMPSKFVMIFLLLPRAKHIWM